jgi:translation elongation factor EF-Tu-like GTPase
MEIAHFLCEATFLITGRGLAVAGVLKNGTFEVGWLVKFSQTNSHPEIIRKVKSIDMINTKQTDKIGFLLETFDDDDAKIIRGYNIENELITIAPNLDI